MDVSLDGTEQPANTSQQVLVAALPPHHAIRVCLPYNLLIKPINSTINSTGNATEGVYVHAYRPLITFKTCI
mgnify:FL=1